jgi:3-oxoadipate enol-lactonase
MPFITLAGDRFHYRFDGPEGAPVLLLSNSLSTNLTMWDGQIALWAKQFRVLRYDSRGHGQSAAPARPYGMAELGQDVLRLMDALKIERAHWCGVSKGGMVGMWLASHAGHRLGKVVLANTAARMGPPDLWNARIATVKAGGMEAVVDATTQRWFTESYRTAQPKGVAAVRKMILGTPADGYAGCCAAIRDMDQREAIRAIENPVLVIGGAQDPATPPAAARLIHETIAGSKLVMLEAAHLSNLELPDQFGQTVREFLA